MSISAQEYTISSWVKRLAAKENRDSRKSKKSTLSKNSDEVRGTMCGFSALLLDYTKIWK